MLGRKQFEDRLVTVTLEALVPEDDFLRRVERVVDFSFIVPLVIFRYSRRGRRSIDPVVVIKILLIGYFYGLTSERRLMREIQVNLSYRRFVGYHLDEAIPDHSTLTKVRARLGQIIFQQIFDDIVRQCIRAGLVKGKHLSFDCTLVEADASLASMVPRMTVLEFTKEVFETNPAEAPPVKEVRTEAAPQQATLKLLPPPADDGAIKRKRSPPLSNDTHVSETDPDAALGKARTCDMSRLCYKDDIAVDSEHRIILSCHALSGNKDESEQLPRHLSEIKSRFGITPVEVSADTKYGTERNYKETEDQGIEAFIPIRKSGENTVTGLFAMDKFAYDETTDIVTCPAGQTLRPQPNLVENKYRLFCAERATCERCPLRAKCTKLGKTRRIGRTISISVNKAYVDRAKERNRTAKGRRAYAIRKTRPETLFGEGKTIHGLRRARWRGLANVHIQFLLTAMAQNIKRMVVLLAGGCRAVVEAAARMDLATQVLMLILRFSRWRGFRNR